MQRGDGCGINDGPLISIRGSVTVEVSSYVVYDGEDIRRAWIEIQEPDDILDQVSSDQPLIEYRLGAGIFEDLQDACEPVDLRWWSAVLFHELDEILGHCRQASPSGRIARFSRQQILVEREVIERHIVQWPCGAFN